MKSLKWVGTVTAQLFVENEDDIKFRVVDVVSQNWD